VLTPLSYEGMSYILQRNYELMIAGSLYRKSAGTVERRSLKATCMFIDKVRSNGDCRRHYSACGDDAVEGNQGGKFSG
jgi:hypothetical protein